MPSGLSWNETTAPFVVLGKFVSEDGRASKNENPRWWHREGPIARQIAGPLSRTALGGQYPSCTQRS